jgi:tetratricopeptide (TPR) repeat protein
MPVICLRGAQYHRHGLTSGLKGLTSAAVMICALGSQTRAQPDAVQPVRSRQVELEYRLTDADTDAEVELWYTRDRSATWQRWGTQKDHNRPLVFEAPAEGLYGFVLIVNDKSGSSAPPPDARTQPQRRVFIDYTPPLVQWDSVEASEAFASRRTVRLRWTAHDTNLAGRPISLWYKSSIDQAWRPIEEELPNSGQYDWTVPVQVSGQITLRIVVRDLGGHLAERLYEPVSIDKWMTAGIPLPKTRPADPASGGAASRPALASATMPAHDSLKLASLTDRQKAEQLWSQGSWYASRNEYAVAAERFREALEINPAYVPAMYDLGAIHYLQKDYDQALDMFSSVLKQDPKHLLALRGMHESYIAQKQYAKSYEMLQQLAKLNGKDAKTWLDLGDVLFMMGQPVEARGMWTKAMNVDPSAGSVISSAQARLSRYGAGGGGLANKDHPKQ